MNLEENVENLEEHRAKHHTDNNPSLVGYALLYLTVNRHAL